MLIICKIILILKQNGEEKGARKEVDYRVDLHLKIEGRQSNFSSNFAFYVDQVTFASNSS